MKKYLLFINALFLLILLLRSGNIQAQITAAFNPTTPAVCESQNITLAAQVSGNIPQPQAKWFFTPINTGIEQALPTYSRYIVTPPGNDASNPITTLQITNAQSIDKGTYRVQFYTKKITEENKKVSTFATLSVNPLPTAPTAASPSPICANETVTLTANGSTGSYKWYDAASGGNLVSNDASYTPTPNLNQSKSFYVSAVSNGCESARTKVDVNVNPMPSATFDASQFYVVINKEVTFSYTGSAAAYSWDFDGGTIISGSGAGPYRITWSTGGNKIVTLQVTAANGCVNTQTKTIYVYEHYAWQGTSDADWQVAANWLPIGTPDPDDAVVISTAGRQPILNTDVAVRDLTIQNSASLDLMNKNLKITGNATFAGGTIHNGALQITCNTATFGGTTFNVSVTTSCDNIYLNGSTFNSTATITKTGSGDNIGSGGAIFKSDATIINNTAASQLILSNLTADNYEGNVTFKNLTVGNIILSGDQDQTINKATGATNLSFVNLKIDKPSGKVVLNEPITIGGILTLIKGNIVSTSTNLLTFEADATVSNAKDDSYVAGPVQRFGTGQFTFPVGKAGKYRPIGIIPTNADASDAFKAEYFADDSYIPVGSHTAKDESIATISTCEYWMLDRAVGNANAKVTLSYDTSSKCTITDPSSLIIAHWTKPKDSDDKRWMNEGHASPELSAAGELTSEKEFTSFSPVTLGSVSINNSLPVELLSFTAMAQKEGILLEWHTASEHDNKGFEVQRSANGVAFNKIAFVEGAGTSQTPTQYTTTDRWPLAGPAYYRLKQIDYAGQTEFSRIISVENRLMNNAWVKVSPNPAPDQATIQLQLPAAQTCRITLSDATGRIRYTNEVPVLASDNILLPLAGYAKGIYYLTVQGTSQMLYQGKLLKE